MTLLREMCIFKNHFFVASWLNPPFLSSHGAADRVFQIGFFRCIKEISNGRTHVSVSKNRGGPPKSSILIGFTLVNYPFWGTTIFGNTHVSRTLKKP